MRIGIDAREPKKGNLTGIGRLSKIFLEQARDKDGFQFVAFQNQDSLPLNLRCKVVKFYEPATFLFERFIFPYYIKKETLDWFLSFYPKLPAAGRLRYAVFIHDLRYLDMRQKISLLKRKLYQRATKEVIKKANVIFVGSKYTKEIILSRFKAKERNISVIPYPVDSIFCIKKEEKESIKALGDYILYVGSFSPLKNVSFLIDVFGEAKKEISAGELKLVLVGKEDEGFMRIKQKVKESTLEKSVKFLTNVDDSYLAGLYNNARLFVSLSLEEGFGLPVAEALACGCRVVCSDISPFREIGLNYPYYVKPYNKQEVVRTILSALNKEISWEKRKERSSFIRSKYLPSLFYESVLKEISA